MCGRDARLAAEFARAILTVANATTPRSLSSILDRIPSSVSVTNEKRIGPKKRGRLRRSSGGRLDWAIEGKAFFVAVEVKIGAGTTAGQLEGYLRDPT